MLALYLLTGSFLCLIFIFVVVFVVKTKFEIHRMNEESKRRYDEMLSQLSDTQGLFRNQVADLLRRFDRLLEIKEDSIKDKK